METTRLRLEPISLTHLEGFHRIWSNPAATQWSSRGTLRTLEETHTWLSGLLPSNRPGADNFAIFLRSPSTPTPTDSHAPDIDDTTLLGVVGVHRVDPVPELGYILHPSVWGRGYATEAVGAFVEYFWQTRPDLDFIEARVDEGNPASSRVLCKCGFVRVQRLEGAAEIPWLEPRVRNLVVYRVERGL